MDGPTVSTSSGGSPPMPPSSAAMRAASPSVALPAGFDPLPDEGLEYAARLRTAGVPVRALHYPGQIHGFVSFDRILAGARDALDRLGGHLCRAFAGSLEPGTDADLPPHRDVDQLLWLNPAQRWHELKVAALTARSWIEPRRARTERQLCP